MFRFDPDGQGHAYTGGSITWYNRTANVQGTVVDTANNIGHVTAYFEAYAGSTKIESVTRTANAESDLGSPRDFNFTIGDTDLVGGIDRIKVTLCRWDGASKDCAGAENYSKL
ncbi:hypothetical protein HLK59_41145 [Streptomyces sp. S3(2020)]|uniref:hypothetical protein n=1 Tax=Streptomyces sp. S3(2020) TaxID=2732044 RepID=UPI001487E523|nr:hypothetical protein [Streptomyces sp. S3(2020)]NNN36654.1 hypothetical protein [Streptomyces sp. S3(2020)]